MAQNVPSPLPLQGSASAFETIAVRGGALRVFRTRTRGRIIQVIALRRDDGSVWNAYERRVMLPPDRIRAERQAREAEVVLSLALAAIMATDLVRMGRREAPLISRVRRWFAGARRLLRSAMP